MMSRLVLFMSVLFPAVIHRAESVELRSLCAEFLEVCQWDEISFLLEGKMMEADPDMLRIAHYLNSTDFEAIVNHMWELDEFVELYDWMLGSGIDPGPLYQWVEDLIHMEPNATVNGTQLQDDLHLMVPEFRRGRDQARSLRSLYDEVKNIIPLHNILTWMIEHCTYDQNMIGFMQKLQEEDTKLVIDHLYNSTEFRDVRCTLIQEGFHIANNEMGLCGFVGWSNCELPKC
eukprot:snap_masked-scaffold556_size137522-processed-gene-0.6 protein:Tk02037 transcript:snap_masked-scaffold556_size137522-processed-gene-0.6-mRNA-1 annotation:"PREDICTED: uncharacterized protein LOC100869547"